MTADPAHRHGGPDAGWYRPDGHGWQRISDGEVRDHGDAAHFMSDPNGRHGGPKFAIGDVPDGAVLYDEDGNEICWLDHGQDAPKA